MITKHEAKDRLKIRRIPCVIAYINPLNIVYSNFVDELSVLKSGIKYKWDNIKLHEVVGGININESQHSLLVCRDGLIALPAVYGYDEHRITREFNFIISSFMLGGHYIRSVDIENIETGFLIDKKYVISKNYSNCYPNVFHRNIRFDNASDIEGALLSSSPRVSINELIAIYNRGNEAVNLLSGVSVDILLRGISKLEKREWLDCLSLLWIVIEQLVARIWSSKVVGDESVKSSKNRLNQLKDNRAWTIANKIEVFFHKKIISMDTVNNLNVSRKARNDLVHGGRPPVQSDVNAAFSAISELISAVIPDFDCAIFRRGFDEIVGSSLVKGDGPVVSTFDAEMPLLPGLEEIYELVEIAERD